MFRLIKNEIIAEIRQDLFNFLECNNPYKGDFKNKHEFNIRKNMLMFFDSISGKRILHELKDRSIIGNR